MSENFCVNDPNDLTLNITQANSTTANVFYIYIYKINAPLFYMLLNSTFLV